MLACSCKRVYDVRGRAPGHHAFTCACGKVFAFTIKPPAPPTRWSLLEID